APKLVLLPHADCSPVDCDFDLAKNEIGTCSPHPPALAMT
ncbi:hypothetical protein DBR06_SOUSAS4410052, partial [Sousa chinensis]